MSLAVTVRVPSLRVRLPALPAAATPALTLRLVAGPGQSRGGASRQPAALPRALAEPAAMLLAEVVGTGFLGQAAVAAALRAARDTWG